VLGKTKVNGIADKVQEVHHVFAMARVPKHATTVSAKDQELGALVA
jgi:hypothetical protein